MFFLSHAGTDAAWATALAEGLKAAGVDVWCDKGPRAIEPGRPFTEQLERRLQESEAFLLLVGLRGVDRWVRAEVDVALERQVNEPTYRFIPLLLPGVHFRQLPPFIARFHALTLEGEVPSWGRQQFQALAKQLGASLSRLPLSPDDCPFLGLESFKEEDAHFYFGRDRELREALARLGQSEGTYRRWLAVEGASGTGKSSFARAGLVPAIRGGWVEGAPSQWRVAVMRPGKHPVHQLARALVRALDWQDDPGKLTQVEEALRSPTGLRNLVSQKLTEAEGFLLVLDQLEEVFTLMEGGRDERRHLDVLLAEALHASDLHFRLITTLRSDFLIRMSELPRLEEALNARWTSRYVLRQMKPEPLREALLGPEQLAGLSWEGGLPERILQDAQVSSGGLPLVAHVLRELWKRRSGQALTHAAYDQLGGVGGALTHSADELLNTFSREEQAHVRRLLLALVKVGRGTRDVRRALTFAEAVAMAGGEIGHGILTRLSGGRAPQMPVGAPAPPRLLTVGTERVDLVHEALLEQWRTLRNWLEESRQVLERQDDLEAAARLWKATGALPSEAQLQYLKSAEPVSADARELLEQVRRAALAQDLVTRTADSAVQEDPQLCLRLIIEAHRLHPSVQTADALLSWYLRRQRLCLRGHANYVKVAAFSPDGQRVLTASRDQTARLWDAFTGQLLTELRGHSGPVKAAAFSPDGQRVLTSSEDQTARLWDAFTGQLLAELRGHSQAVLAAVFSPDGQWVLTASGDQTARLWDAFAGKLLAELRGHSGPVTAAAFSPDGQRLLTASGDRTARLWSVTTRAPLAMLHGHSGYVKAASFSPDGQKFLTASGDQTVRIWDTVTGKLLATLRGHSGSVKTATFSHDGQRVVTASGDRTARIWDAPTGTPLAALRGHSGPVKAATFSPDGQRVLTASGDQTARLWDAMTGAPLAILHGHSGSVKAAAFSPDGQRVLTTSNDRTARLWDATIGAPLATLRGHFDYLEAAAFSPDGQQVLTASSDQTARIWDPSTGKLLTTLYGHTGLVEAAAFSPDGRRALTASSDQTARLWDAFTGIPLATLRGHSQAVLAAAFSPDGQQVLTASSDQTARLWDATTGASLATLRGHHSYVKAAAFSPDGQRVLTASGDQTARLWDATTGKLLAELRGHSGPLTAAAFSPDGQRVLTASGDQTARLWDASTGNHLTTLRGHSESVDAAAFSPDGQRVLTASGDRTAWLWDATTGKPLAEMRGHSGYVKAAAFSPDGQRILIPGKDKTARIWWVYELCAPTEELFERGRAILFRDLTEEERQHYLREALR
jgi:WD40 repeat protein